MDGRARHRDARVDARRRHAVAVGVAGGRRASRADRERRRRGGARQIPESLHRRPRAAHSSARMALEELNRMAGKPGIRAVHLPNSMENGDFLFQPAYDALWARCQELGYPILFHPLDGADNIYGGKERLGNDLALSANLNNTLGFSFESATTAAKFIITGTLDRFPTLDIVLPHSGGCFPYVAGRIERGLVAKKFALAGRSATTSGGSITTRSPTIRKRSGSLWASSDRSRRHRVGWLRADGRRGTERPAHAAGVECAGSRSHLFAAMRRACSGYRQAAAATAFHSTRIGRCRRWPWRRRALFFASRDSTRSAPSLCSRPVRPAAP